MVMTASSAATSNCPKLRRRRKDRPRCGAKTRAGGTCMVRVELGKARCRFHGGMSTGPKTAAGRAPRRVSALHQLAASFMLLLGDENSAKARSAAWRDASEHKCDGNNKQDASGQH
jgi:hypothetical protein